MRPHPQKKERVMSDNNSGPEDAVAGEARHKAGQS